MYHNRYASSFHKFFQISDLETVAMRVVERVEVFTYFVTFSDFCTVIKILNIFQNFFVIFFKHLLLCSNVHRFTILLQFFRLPPTLLPPFNRIYVRSQPIDNQHPQLFATL